MHDVMYKAYVTTSGQVDKDYPNPAESSAAAYLFPNGPSFYGPLPPRFFPVNND